MRHQYKSGTLQGNLHDLAVYLNAERPEWQLVAAEVTGHYVNYIIMQVQE